LEGSVFSKWPTLEPPTEAATTEHCLFFFSTPIPNPHKLLFLRCRVDEGRKRDWWFVMLKTRTVLIPELTKPSMEQAVFQIQGQKNVDLSKSH